MSIVYRGALTLEKLQDLAEAHLGLKENDSKDFDPSHNHDAVSLRKQPDGNWKGTAFRNGSLIEVREVGPETALQALITHS